MFLVATNIVASHLLVRRLTGTLTTRAKNGKKSGLIIIACQLLEQRQGLSWG